MVLPPRGHRPLGTHCLLLDFPLWTNKPLFFIKHQTGEDKSGSGQCSFQRWSLSRVPQGTDSYTRKGIGVGSGEVYRASVSKKRDTCYLQKNVVQERKYNILPSLAVKRIYTVTTNTQLPKLEEEEVQHAKESFLICGGAGLFHSGRQYLKLHKKSQEMVTYVCI